MHLILRTNEEKEKMRARGKEGRGGERGELNLSPCRPYFFLVVEVTGGGDRWCICMGASAIESPGLDMWDGVWTQHRGVDVRVHLFLFCCHGGRDQACIAAGWFKSSASCSHRWAKGCGEWLSIYPSELDWMDETAASAHTQKKKEKNEWVARTVLGVFAIERVDNQRDKSRRGTRGRKKNQSYSQGRAGRDDKVKELR